MSRSRIPGPLAGLLVAGALLAAAWSLIVPAFQGPDEASHFAAVSRLVEQGTLLPSAGDGEGLPAEVVVAAEDANLGPLVGNIDARPAFTATDERRWREHDRALDGRRHEPLTTATGLPVQGANRNPPLYALYEAPAYLIGRGGSVFARLQLMRLWSIPLLLITIACTWKLAAELLPGTPWAPALAAGVVAIQPELTFIAGTLNPDLMLAAVGAAFLLAAIRLVRDGPSPWRIGVVFALAVAATLTHARGTILIAGVVIALVLALIGRGLPARRVSLSLGATLAGCAAVIAGRVLEAHNTGVALFGGTSRAGVGAAGSVRNFLTYLWQFYLPPLPFMNPPLGGRYGIREAWIETGFGVFGSLEVRFPAWVYTVVELLLAVIAAGAIVALVQGWAKVRARWREALLLVLVVLVYVLSLHLVAYRSLLVDPSDPILVGRHLFPVLPLLAVAVALAVSVVPRGGARVAGGVVLGAASALVLAGLGATLARFTL